MTLLWGAPSGLTVARWAKSGRSSKSRCVSGRSAWVIRGSFARARSWSLAASGRGVHAPDHLHFLKTQRESKGISGKAGALLVSQSKYNEKHERIPSDGLG